MKAAVSRRYGPPEVVRVEEVEAPEPSAHDVLVRNRAAVVSAVESIARSGSSAAARAFFGWRRPRFPVLGNTFVGEVYAIGGEVTRHAVGDRVVGVTGPRPGAHAEFVRVRDSGVLVETTLNWVDAAAVTDGALTALPFLRDAAHLQPGHRVVVNGAAGAIGSAAVQLAVYRGARVTAVCRASNADLVRSLGAEEVIDYERDDFTQSDPGSYDVVFDTVGTSSYRQCRPLLARGGVYLTTTPSLAILAQTVWTGQVGSTRAAIEFTGLRSRDDIATDLSYIVALAEHGRYTPVIDSVFPLTDVARAHARVDGRHKRGSVVVTF